MDILKSLFSIGGKNYGPEDLTQITRIIGPIINKTACDIVKLQAIRLLTGPIDYIIPAVWGARLDGELEPTQKEIHRRITSLTEHLFDMLHLEDLSQAQKFAVGFLMRELIISKIVFLIQLAKNQAAGKFNTGEYHTDILNHLSPLGNA